jgi:hypothetical protein
MRDPADVIDPDLQKVRVLSSRCTTCIFRRGNPMHLGENRHGRTAADIIQGNVAAGALLTCHQTLPYGDHPEVPPAVCAGFWAEHGPATAAGRIAIHLIGIVRVPPPE